MVIHSNPSFKEVLLSSEGEKTDLDVNSDDENELMDEDDTDTAEEDANFESDDEVQFGLVSGIPSIIVSDRIQEVLAKKWQQSVIVLLLGRPLSYKTLCENILLLRKPRGHYLTVHPWSQTYSSDMHNISKWWLGFVFQIEYEGLPRICFNCGMYEHTKEVCTKQAISPASKEYPQESTQRIEAEESIYGPWMIASRRKQRRNKSRSNQRVMVAINRVEHKGSRFSILDDVSHDLTNEDQNGSHIGERLNDERSIEPTPNVIVSQKNLINISNNVIQGNTHTNKATTNIDYMDANNRGNAIGKAKTNDKVNQEPHSTMDVDPSVLFS
ncbi:Uncharacterized protein TCM_002747 [Theobroma cacao]|uniref:DUF4283 domain-containing protein n=1 Tax=Theobroma cacao TaxID=3641 RepID=A0A061DM86_THECC|nr:Uncharacterized protein TCM_002747 [Theobroma cacao]